MGFYRYLPYAHNINTAIRYANNIWSYENYYGTTNYGDITSDYERIEKVFKNPAVLKVFKLNCDLFSLGKIHAYKDDVRIEDTELVKKLKHPNYFQSGKQFLWDYMFWRMLGSARLYVPSKVPRESLQMYWLDSSNIEYSDSWNRYADRLILSKGQYNEYLNQTIRYKTDDGTNMRIAIRDILTFFDTTNGTGNWFEGRSPIEALYKVIQNSEESLDAKNINVRYTARFLVSGGKSFQDTSQLPMQPQEKAHIEDQITYGRPVQAVKSMLDIKRYVDNLSNLKLPEHYKEDLFLIGNLYNIPRDVMELYQSSTYENQEKARATHVSYTLEPASEDLMNRLEKHFGYDVDGIDLKMSWDHLPLMQVFQGQNLDNKLKKLQAMEILIRNGASATEAAEYCQIENISLDDEEARNNARGNRTGVQTDR